jgi:hypothetical protein
MAPLSAKALPPSMASARSIPRAAATSPRASASGPGLTVRSVHGERTDVRDFGVRPAGRATAEAMRSHSTAPSSAQAVTRARDVPVVRIDGRLR